MALPLGVCVHKAARPQDAGLHPQPGCDLAGGSEGIGFLRHVPEMGIVTQTTRWRLQQANEETAYLRTGQFAGATVLVP